MHEVTLDGFDIDATCVPNEQFSRFIDATGYRTDAERFGYSAVFFQLVSAADREAVVGQPLGTPWWLGIKGAD